MAKIGVFICRCEARPGQTRDPALLARQARRDPRVAFVEIIEDVCTRPMASELGRAASEHAVDGVVVAACDPAVHETSFRSALSLHGIAPERVFLVDTMAPGDLSPALIEALDRASEEATPLKEEEAVPRALVIGGGVAGIQASLDIADGGFEVYLVEKDPSIGGHMLQLSEVFPTLDCPQCIMTPKMVEAAQHPNIKLEAYAEVDSIEGRAGHFKAKIRHKTPYIEWDKCTGCSECANACPVEVFSYWDSGIAPTGAASRPFAQAVPNKFTITKNGVSPCRVACPAGLNAHAYVSLTRARKFDRALEVVRDGVLFPGILGRVCPHPCERACLRATLDEAVSICSIKRFLADRIDDPVPLPEREPDTGKKVAVVGAGPAGLAAAIDLRRAGVAVTVFEETEHIGGQMTAGIPSFRLPREVVKKETEDLLLAMGVEFRLGTRVGRNVPLDDLRRDFDAVLLAVGAWKGAKPSIPGGDLGGVHKVVEFMTATGRGHAPAVGKRVVVLGAGHPEIDAGRTALRLGAEEVTLVYRRTRNELPSAPEEVRAAEEEGVVIRFLSSPVEILGEDGKVTGLRLGNVALGEPDRAGHRRPVPVPDSEETLACDTVIASVRQAPDREGFDGDDGPPVTRMGSFEVDRVTNATPLDGVFAAGDAVTGSDTVVGAVAGGRRASESILRQLRGADLYEGREPEQRPVVEEPDTTHAVSGARATMPEIPIGERRASFREVECGLDEETAVAEAGRCLSCAICCECMECVEACEAKAVNHDLEDRIEEIEVGAVVMATGYDLYEPSLVSEYDVDPDVIDGMQFERILCPSGPSDGRVFCPSDGREPKEVVIVSCVGSRDPEHHKAYCSRVCCMYSIKMAMLYKHAVHDGAVHFLYMDVRADGKLYEEFYQRAAEEDGVNFIRGRASRIFRDGEQLVVRGADTLTDMAIEIRADLVVLATAMVPRESGIMAARRFGLELDANGFIRERHGKLMPLDSSREGIFLAGTAQGPKDIPECVAHASGAAGRVLALLGRGRFQAREKQSPEPILSREG